jgi:phosphoribosylcarboxyaminoimidazole (NCAIR) mutase
MAPLLLAVCLGGCAASFERLPVVGLPEGAPKAPSAAPSYLPVEDLPPPRDEPVMTEAEREKATAALLASRTSVEREVKAAARADAEREAEDRRIRDERRREAEARSGGE